MAKRAAKNCRVRRFGNVHYRGQARVKKAKTLMLYLICKDIVAAGGRFLNPPCPAANESSGIYTTISPRLVSGNAREA
jgi:hypothetical protein